MDRRGARVRVADRNRIELRAVHLEGLLPADHRARVVWAYGERLDLSPLYDETKAVEGHAGRQQAAQKRAARASTTDPEARAMKGPDGGLRPGCNVRFATASGAGIVVGGDITDQGADPGQLSPLGQQLKRRCGCVPQETVVDGGFVTPAGSEAGAGPGSTVHAPLSEPKNPDRDRHRPLRGELPAVAAWRVRTGTRVVEAIRPRRRAATAEWANARARNRGLRQIPARGHDKAKAVARSDRAVTCAALDPLVSGLPASGAHSAASDGR